ncbi:hypothetical protein INT48_004223, partial [Thamnidium elegans]
AAHAIIAEIGPLRVSSDALSFINLFLDEFIAILVMSSVSLDLVLLKTAVIQLLPHTLGKNALVEAEIELKHQVDSKQYDFTNYEKMRNQQFPTDQLIPCLQLACTNHCTLATDNNHASPVVHGIIGIAPVVVIYVTTIVEHIAEYVLNSVAMTADQADAEHIRVKEVLVTLLDDPQVSKLFRRMNLKDKLEKRVYSHSSYLPTPSASPISRDHHTSFYIATYKDTIHPDISFNEFLEDEVTRALPSSNSSMRSSESMSDRPLSILSNGTVKSNSSKSRFNFFSSNKEKRNSISFSFSSSKKSPITSPTNSTFPSSNDFDDLIRSGNTKKVTLTPNRLRSIEVKEEVTPWERFKSPARTKNRSTTPPPPIPPLPRLNKDNDTSSPPLTPASSVASRPSQKSRHSIIYEEKTTKSNNEELFVLADTKKEEKLKPRFERPSSMVVKRASMGSRPPSFHENAFMDLNLLATAGTVEPKSIEDLKTHYERRNEKPKEQADLIYVIPNRTQSRFNNNYNNKPRTVDKACQTEPIELHTLANSEQIEEDEEWFIEEEEWEDDSEEEKSVAEWLLGNI